MVDKRYKVLYEKLSELVLEQIQSIQSHPQSREEMFIGASALRVISNQTPIYELLNNEFYDQASMVIRNSLESYVSFYSVVIDKSFFDNIIINNNETKIKILNHLLQSSPEKSYEADIVELKNINDDLIEKGAFSANIFERFKKCNYVKMFKSSYRVLCNIHHSSFMSLQERFVVVGEAESPHLQLENELPKNEKNLVWNTAIWVLHNAIVVLLEYHKKDDPRISELGKELQSLSEEHFS